MVANFSQNPRLIDRTQVQQQLEALGYKPGDSIFLRAFYPQGDPRKDTDKGRKAEASNIDEVIRLATHFQKEGRGVYLVVNGGGHLDKEVPAARAIFYEHDDLDKDIQTDLWQHLGLPEPTVQVDTGGKSIHSYWVFDIPIEIDDWRELQRDLLEYSDGGALKNPSRVMRLAGCWHPLGNQSRIIRNSLQRYDYSHLRKIVPRQQSRKPIQPLFDAPKTSRATNQGIKYDDIQVPVPAVIPLVQCLSKKSRMLIEQGVSQGGRNQAGAKLARDLIGTANYLRTIEQQFIDLPEVLFNNFAMRCNPPLDLHEIQDIWRKAERANPSPSSKEEGVNNCITAWYWNNHIKAEKRCSIYEAETRRQTSDFGVSYQINATVEPKQRPAAVDFDRTRSRILSIQHAAEQARSILKECDDEIAANIRLENVRLSCGMSDYSWANNIIKPLKRELEGSRFKLELLGLLQMEDEVERERLIAQLAPKYSMSARRVEKAMNMMRSRTQTPETKVFDLDELFDLEVNALSWIVPGILPEAETIVLAGAPKSGKTLLAIDLAYAVATGEADFLGEGVQCGKVLLVSTDETPASTRNKLLNRGFRRCDKDLIKIVPSWDISQLSSLEKILEDFRPTVTIIDSLRRINKGSEISENSAEFADNIYTLKETLTRYKSAGVLIHHTNKDREALGVDRLRGSSAIAGATWGVWQIDQIAKPDPNNKKRLIIDPKDPKRLLSVFARDAEGQQLNIELDLSDSSWRNLGSSESEEEQAAKLTIRDRILRVLTINPSPMSGKAIIECFDIEDISPNSIYNELNAISRKRLINSKPAPGDKRYKVFSLARKSQQNSRNTLPPLPPTPNVQNMTNFSEIHTVIGFEDSHIDSHLIVISQTGTTEPEIAEPHTETGIENSHIDMTVTRGGGVERNSTEAHQPIRTSELDLVVPVARARDIATSNPATSHKGSQTNASIPTPAEQLADLVRAATTYEQVEAAKAQYPGVTNEAAKLLTTEELERIKNLKPPELVLSERLKNVNTLADFKAIVLEFASSYRGTQKSLNEAIEEAIARVSISRGANQLYSWWNQIWKEI
ncbi:AAA family ATPase [Microseira sp. BLCC-F43]|jgi:Fe2+ or Zn2+ uptake regulation protein|uniref:AAA family ATPase n=1 Tax=Microseira sp. BLCC-F43 TaxID=3153602 RepID=UPI0035B8C5C6